MERGVKRTGPALPAARSSAHLRHPVLLHLLHLLQLAGGAPLGPALYPMPPGVLQALSSRGTLVLEAALRSALLALEGALAEHQRQRGACGLCAPCLFPPCANITHRCPPPAVPPTMPPSCQALLDAQALPELPQRNWALSPDVAGGQPSPMAEGTPGPQSLPTRRGPGRPPTFAGLFSTVGPRLQDWVEVLRAMAGGSHPNLAREQLPGETWLFLQVFGEGLAGGTPCPSGDHATGDQTPAVLPCPPNVLWPQYTLASLGGGTPISATTGGASCPPQLKPGLPVQLLQSQLWVQPHSHGSDPTDVCLTPQLWIRPKVDTRHLHVPRNPSDASPAMPCALLPCASGSAHRHPAGAPRPALSLCLLQQGEEAVEELVGQGRAFLTQLQAELGLSTPLEATEPRQAPGDPAGTPVLNLEPQEAGSTAGGHLREKRDLVPTLPGVEEEEAGEGQGKRPGHCGNGCQCTQRDPHQSAVRVSAVRELYAWVLQVPEPDLAMTFQEILVDLGSKNAKGLYRAQVRATVGGRPTAFNGLVGLESDSLARSMPGLVALALEALKT
nr:PREDICTED: serine protease 56 [Struthio camelus australis]